MSWLDSMEWSLLLAGFALLHVTWQTFVAAAVVAGLQRFGARVSVRLRYATSYTLFLALPALALATAYLLASSRRGGFVVEVPAASSESIPWLATAAPWIGLVWVMGVLACTTRLLGGAVWTARAVACGEDPDRQVAGRVLRCAQRLGMRRGAPVKVSRDVAVPSVVGLRKPTILLPTGFLRELDMNEVDAIIAHELCHVCRRDLWANAIQHLVGALLFFHPAARFMSRAIDGDRDICCDELVTRVGVCERIYARALARVALRDHGALALGLGAGAGDVSARIRRLVDPTPAPLGRHPLLAGAALLALTLLGTGSATRALIPLTAQVARAAPVWEARLLADLPYSYTVNAVDPAGEFTVSVDAGRVTKATVAGTELAPPAIRQRGAHVTFVGARPDEAFSVVLRPGGGIKWLPRSPSSND